MTKTDFQSQFSIWLFFEIIKFFISFPIFVSSASFLFVNFPHYNSQNSESLNLRDEVRSFTKIKCQRIRSSQNASLCNGGKKIIDSGLPNIHFNNTLLCFCWCWSWNAWICSTFAWRRKSCIKWDWLQRQWPMKGTFGESQRRSKIPVQCR